MDENTIFQGSIAETTNQNKIGSKPQPPLPVENQPTSQEPTPPASMPPALTVPPPVIASSSPFSMILKIALGILVVVVLAFLVYRFVLPNFSEKKSQQVTLSYWGLWEDKNIMGLLISDFKREYPHITVNYTKEDIKQYRERLATRIENGTGPDIFRYHNTWIPQLSNLVLPLPSDVVSQDDFKKTYYSVVQKDLVRSGAIYGIPLGIDTLELFINTELFEAGGATIPQTWDDFIKTARLLTVKDESSKIKTAGAAIGTFDNITHAPDIISLLFIQNGADVSNLQKTNKAASDALNFYTSFSSGEDNVWDATLDPSILAFAKGNLAMYFGYSWDVFLIKAANPDLSFTIHPVPHLPGRTITIASYWAEGVSSKSKHQKEAFLFMKFLHRRETAEKFFSETAKTRLFGEPYARLDLASSLKDNPLVYPFVQQAQNASSSFFASDTFDNGLNSKMNAYLGNAIRSLFGNSSSETAVETLSQGVSQVLSQYESP